MRTIRMAAAALLALAPIACDEAGPTEAPLSTPLTQFSLVSVSSTPFFIGVESIRVCKVGPDGVPFSFTVGAVPGAGVMITDPVLFNGQCEMVVQLDGPQYFTTVEETLEPGFVLDSVAVYQGEWAIPVANPIPAPSNLTHESWADGTNQVTVSGGRIFDGSGVATHVTGALVVYYNSAEPPTTGGQGCTPGYWKQSQHFGSWPAPYTPGTSFASVFSDAFPGATLLDVVSQGGGGLKALGRHTVAALLNSASGEVSSGMTGAGVIAAFNAAYASGDYETQKNVFEGLNEQGCPLGLNP